MGENHERGNKNLVSGTARGTMQRESTQSVCHFWTLVWIGLFFLAVVLAGRYKKYYFL
jgi:hypothetical protein